MAEMKLDLSVDARKAIRGVGDFGEALGDVVSDLEKVAREGDDTEDALVKNFRRIADASDKASDSVKRDFKKGFDDVKDEAASSGKEAAASFTGGFDDVADFVQETLANALGGLGPVGAVAGVAAAAGLGILVSEVEKATEAVEALQEQARNLSFDALDEGKGVEEFLTQTDQVLERLKALAEQGQKKWRFWWEEDQSALAEFNENLRKVGIVGENAFDIFSLGDRELQTFTDTLKDNNKALAEERDLLRITAQRGGEMTEAEMNRLAALDKIVPAQERVIETLETENETRREAKETEEALRDSGVSSALERAQAAEDATARIEEAAQAEADKRKAVSDAVRQDGVDAYDRIRDAAVDAATSQEGVFDVGQWITLVAETKAQAEQYQTNLQTLKLTPDQWENLLALPEDARQAIVNSYAVADQGTRDSITSSLSDVGATGGSGAAVAFDEAFQPDADVEVTVSTGAAEKAIERVTRSAEKSIVLEVDARGVSPVVSQVVKPVKKPIILDVQSTAANQEINNVARSRTAYVGVSVNTWGAEQALNHLARTRYTTVVARVVDQYGRQVY